MKKIGILIFIIVLIVIGLYPVIQTRKEEGVTLEAPQNQLNGMILKV